MTPYTYTEPPYNSPELIARGRAERATERIGRQLDSVRCIHCGASILRCSDLCVRSEDSAHLWPGGDR